MKVNFNFNFLIFPNHFSCLSSRVGVRAPEGFIQNKRFLRSLEFSDWLLKAGEACP
jgi:hypothetical protein